MARRCMSVAAVRSPTVPVAAWGGNARCSQIAQTVIDSSRPAEATIRPGHNVRANRELCSVQPATMGSCDAVPRRVVLIVSYQQKMLGAHSISAIYRLHRTGLFGVNSRCGLRGPRAFPTSSAGSFFVRADTSDVAFRLLLALGELWDGLDRAGVEPTAKGLHVTQEYLGGYTRFSAGPGSHARLVVEWNGTTRHLRVLRCEPWANAEATISTTVAHVRTVARTLGLAETVDRALVAACGEPSQPCRRTVLSTAASVTQAVASARRA